MNRQFPGASPSSIFGRREDTQMDFKMDAPSACFQAQHPPHIPHDQPNYMEQNSYGFRFPLSDHYQDLGWEYHQTLRSHQRHQSTSTQSTNSSYIRSSNGSDFSQFDYPRTSFASTNTAYSTFSEFSREQPLTQTDRMLDSHSPITSPPPPSLPSAPFDGLAAPSLAKRGPQRQARQEKEPFQDCRSRTKRSRHSQKEPRYWCTSCKEGFREKYDWKRHEETYQERIETFACNLCKNIYFLDKDFVHHHQTSHRCQVCAEDQHVDIARRKRMTRTGWGCGFCTHFSKDWTERCNHISWHFEKNHDTMAKWHHSRVIWSLLQRPDILPQWYRLFEIKGRTTANFSWKHQTTGRVEGYPEANPIPQLQDRLEYYTPDQDSAKIAQLAFDMGVREKQSPREKDLPQIPARPPVPEKDHRQLPATQEDGHNSIQQLSMRPTSSPDTMNDAPWDIFLNTIIEDEIQPSEACPLGPDDLNAAFSYVPHNLHSFQ